MTQSHGSETASDARDSAADAPGQYDRCVAKRLLATEFNDAVREFTDHDDPRDTSYTEFPTGVTAHRVLVTGYPTERTQRNGIYRVVLADGTPDTLYAYQTTHTPSTAVTTLRDLADAPTERQYLAVMGKILHTTGDDGTEYVSVAIEAATTVEAASRRQWAVRAAGATLDRCRNALGDQGHSQTPREGERKREQTVVTDGRATPPQAHLERYVAAAETLLQKLLV